ncbi:MAG: response regulator [Planctomycetota bacterium]|jgi:DNA-binding NtrC family response regulator
MNVIVAEDDKITRDHAVVGLENFGNFDVDVAQGMSAVDMLSQKDYDIALVGINPGDPAGPDLLEDIRARNIKLDIVVMAGDIIAKNMSREKIHSNIFAFINKPIDPQHFHQTINRLKLRILERK